MVLALPADPALVLELVPDQAPEEEALMQQDPVSQQPTRPRPTVHRATAGGTEQEAEERSPNAYIPVQQTAPLFCSALTLSHITSLLYINTHCMASLQIQVMYYKQYNKSLCCR